MALIPTLFRTVTLNVVGMGTGECQWSAKCECPCCVQIRHHSQGTCQLRYIWAKCSPCMTRCISAVQVQVQVCFTSVGGQVQPLDVALRP
jgi:hypothetical protein